MLQNELFTFSDLVAWGDLIRANVTIAPSHPIFEGHFPGRPVLPGVCTMQMVKELLENHLQTKTRLVKADDIKFLSPIVPGEEKSILIDFKTVDMQNYVKVIAKLTSNDEILFKFNGLFEPL